MREIKFRGKRIDNNEMIFGCLVNNMWTYSELSNFEKGTKVCEIFTGEFGSDNWLDAIEEDNFIFSVYPESVGQFTGLKDKNGTDIYEGDIVQDIIVGMKSEIVFTEYANFGIKSLQGVKDLQYDVIDPAWAETSLIVIGNIYEK